VAKLVWAVFCQTAIVDRATNNVSVINQLDTLSMQRPPQSVGVVAKNAAGRKVRTLAAFPCTVVTVWERDKPTISESSELAVDFLGPKREPVGTFRASVDLRKTRRARLMANVPGIPLVGEGTYRFVLKCRHGVKWRRVGELTFQLSYTDAPPQRTH
jgi:hypothetical protein